MSKPTSPDAPRAALYTIGAMAVMTYMALGWVVLIAASNVLVGAPLPMVAIPLWMLTLAPALVLWLKWFSKASSAASGAPAAEVGQ